MDSNQHTSHKEAIENLLENWEKQTAPDFLSTRVLSRINSTVDEKISNFTWATFTVLILINCSILYKTIENKSIQNISKTQRYSNYIEENYQLFTNYQSQL